MKRIFFITGLPLSGKSATARALQGLLQDSVIISTGDIARELVANDSALDAEMQAKDLFPVEDALRIELLKRVESVDNYNVIVEGMPRYNDQVNFIKDKFWHYFPVIIFTEVGDLITLYNRAKFRARDERDFNQDKFVKRLELASANLADVKITAQQQILPVYGIFTTGDDDSRRNQLAHIIKDNR